MLFAFAFLATFPFVTSAQPDQAASAASDASAAAAASTTQANPPTGAAPSQSITHTVHVPFENCVAKDVTLTVTLLNGRAPVAPPVHYVVTLHNWGARPCGPPNSQLPVARRSLTLGPCGQLATVIGNDFGVNVYPGAAVYYNCPESVGLHLPAHGTASASGSWAGYEYLGRSPGWQHAPSGPYRLIVDERVSVPFKLVTGSR